MYSYIFNQNLKKNTFVKASNKKEGHKQAEFVESICNNIVSNISEVEKRGWSSARKKQLKLPIEPTYNSVYVTRMREDYNRAIADVFGVIKQHMFTCGDHLLIDADGKHWCPLSAEFIAKKTSWSIRTVRNTIKTLRDEGLIETKLKYIRHGKRVNYFSITQKGANYLITYERKFLNLLFIYEDHTEKKESENVKNNSTAEGGLQKSESANTAHIKLRVINNHIEKVDKKKKVKSESAQIINQPVQKVEKIQMLNKEELKKICKDWSKNQVIGLAVNQSQANQYLYDCNGNYLVANNKLASTNNELMNENSRLRWQVIALKKFIKKKGYHKGYDETVNNNKVIGTGTALTEEQRRRVEEINKRLLNEGRITLLEFNKRQVKQASARNLN